MKRRRWHHAVPRGLSRVPIELALAGGLFAMMAIRMGAAWWSGLL